MTFSPEVTPTVSLTLLSCEKRSMWTGNPRRSNERNVCLSQPHVPLVRAMYRCVLHYPLSYGRDNDNNFPISSAQMGKSVPCLCGLFFPRFRRSPRVARPSIMQGDPPVKSRVGKAGEEKIFLSVCPSPIEKQFPRARRGRRGRRKLKSVFANVWRG